MMESILIRFKNKDYYIEYDDLLNKSNNKLFAYEDKGLTKNATLNGKILIFSKKNMENKLKNSIKMSSPMPGSAKTENKMTSEQKFRKYIKEMIREALKENDPYGQPDEDKYLFKTGQDYLNGIQGESLNEAKKMSIVGTTKFLDCVEGNIIFENDSNIKKWWKQFNEDENEISFDNYDDIRRQIEKILGVKVENLFSDYWDENYSKYLYFFVNSMDMDTEIKKKLKGKIFKAKFTAETFPTFVNEEGEVPNDEELAAKKKSEKEAQRKQAYQRFFSQALAKFGYSSPSSIPDEKKKSFYDYIDANWTSKQEELPKTEGYANWPNYRDNNNEYYEIDLTKCTHNEAINIIDKLKYKPGIIDVSYSDSVFHTEPGVDLTKYLTTKELKCVKKRNINETSATGGVAGYETPAAFTGKKDISKKQKSIANQLGYELVDKSYATKDQGDVQDLKEGKPITNKEIEIFDKLIKIMTAFTIPGDEANLDTFVIEKSHFRDIASEILDYLSNIGIIENKLNEGIDSLYLKDENLTPEQKLGLAMRHVRNNLYEVEKVIQRTIKMKNENGIDSSKVGKRTYSALKRINEKVIRLMVALNDLK